MSAALIVKYFNHLLQGTNSAVSYTSGIVKTLGCITAMSCVERSAISQSLASIEKLILWQGLEAPSIVLNLSVAEEELRFDDTDWRDYMGYYLSNMSITVTMLQLIETVSVELHAEQDMCRTRLLHCTQLQTQQKISQRH